MKTFNYQIARVCATPAFKKKYNLKIINAEKIPKEGPILLCGNHLHVLDQFPVICATSRTTHWMAKKEYFDSKLGIFFKLTGAICVDRFGDSKPSENEALDYLKKGSAVGLFPEGTRNGLKEEKIKSLYDQYFAVDNALIKEEFINIIKAENPRLSQVNLLERLYEEGKINKKKLTEGILETEKTLKKMLSDGTITRKTYDKSLLLPFKYGAVSMAKKSNATIVPFGVTGKYVKNSDNLIVNFGDTMKVGEDLSLANQELSEKVLHLVKETYKTNI